MWRLVNERVSSRQDPARDQALVQRLGRAIHARIWEDRCMRTEEAGVLIKRLPGAYHPLHREDWHQMKGWYWAVVDCATPPARVNLDRIMADWVELYCYIPPPRENITVSVELFPAEDLVPTED